MHSAYSPASVKAVVALAANRQLQLRDERRRRIELEPQPTSYTDPELRRQRAYDDPEWYAREILGVHLYAEQVDMLLAVKAASEANREAHESSQVSVVGANGVGKDFNIGRVIVPWWLEVFEPAKVLITAPTGRQVFDIVWQELRSSYNASKYPLRGRMLPKGAEWDVGPDSFARGFSTDKGFSLLGYHSPHLLAIVSEAHAFGEGHLTNIRRLLPQVLLMSGNPLADMGGFYESHHSRRAQYRTIEISAWDSPNVKQGGERVPGLVSREDIAALADAWGVPFEKLEDLKETGKISPLFDSTVNGNFSTAPDGLIPLAWLVRAQQPALDQGGPVWAGVDAAGPGEDETVMTIAEAQTVDGEPKDAIILQKGWRKAEAEGDVIAELLPFAPRLQAVGVDSIGLGESWPRIINQALIEAGFHGVARGINVAVTPTSDHNKRNYDRLKDQLYFGLRERFQANTVIGLSAKASGQLASMRYRNNLRGRKQVESKDDMVKRGVPSPDWGESTMLLFAVMGSGLLTDAPDEDAERPLPALQRSRELDRSPGEMPFAGVRNRTF